MENLAIRLKIRAKEKWKNIFVQKQKMLLAQQERKKKTKLKISNKHFSIHRKLRKLQDKFKKNGNVSKSNAQNYALWMYKIKNNWEKIK